MATRVYEVEGNHGDDKRYLRVSEDDLITFGPLAPGAKGFWMVRVYEKGDKKRCIAAFPACGFREVGKVDLLDARAMKAMFRNVADAKDMLAFFEKAEAEQAEQPKPKVVKW